MKILCAWAVSQVPTSDAKWTSRNAMAKSGNGSIQFLESMVSGSGRFLLQVPRIRFSEKHALPSCDQSLASNLFTPLGTWNVKVTIIRSSVQKRHHYSRNLWRSLDGYGRHKVSGFPSLFALLRMLGRIRSMRWRTTHIIWRRW